MNIDLRANPFFLTEEDCDWVHETIAAMTIIFPIDLITKRGRSD